MTMRKTISSARLHQTTGCDVKERWLELCEQAVAEQNLGKLSTFTIEINSLVESQDQQRPIDRPQKPSRARSASDQESQEDSLYITDGKPRQVARASASSVTRSARPRA